MSHLFFRRFTNLFCLLGIALVLAACTATSTTPDQIATPQNTLPAIETLVITSSPDEADCSSLRSNEPMVARLYPGSIVRLIEGPVCADGVVFWKVGSYPTGIGWTAEGDGRKYFLEPIR